MSSRNLLESNETTENGIIYAKGKKSVLDQELYDMRNRKGISVNTAFLTEPNVRLSSMKLPYSRVNEEDSELE